MNESDVISIKETDSMNFNYIESENPFERSMTQCSEQLDYGFYDYEKSIEQYDPSVTVNENNQEVFLFTTDNIPDMSF